MSIHSTENETSFVNVHYDSVAQILNIESDKSQISEIVLYNNLGQLIVNQPIDNNIKINLEYLAFGLYITVVNINGQLSPHKIFISD